MAGCGIVEAFEDGTAVPDPEVLVRLAAELGWSDAEIAPLLEETRRRVWELDLWRATTASANPHPSCSPGRHRLKAPGVLAGLSKPPRRWRPSARRGLRGWSCRQAPPVFAS